MSLLRLVIDFRAEELVVRCLYRTKGETNCGTKARQREVLGLARMGLTQALEALQGRADVVGTSGFTTREDVLLATTSSETAKQVRKG